jgi:NAD(P)-dependent dehydrogenase (short-subunit alcohol dehydrogenase family)
MLMLDWNHKLKVDGVIVFSVSPGFCATGLGGLGADLMEAMGAETVSEGSRRLLTVAKGKRDADTGKIIDKVGFLAW